MTRSYLSNYHDLSPYIPASLSEVQDLVGSMVLDAPTFVDETGVFPERNIDSRFHQLLEGFSVVRRKLGEQRYAKLEDLATRAKALFADDPEDTNGKTDEGRALLFEIENVLREVRARRTTGKLGDDEDEVTDD